MEIFCRNKIILTILIFPLTELFLDTFTFTVSFGLEEIINQQGMK
jgi:hypothetical protein